MNLSIKFNNFSKNNIYQVNGRDLLSSHAGTVELDANNEILLPIRVFAFTNLFFTIKGQMFNSCFYTEQGNHSHLGLAHSHTIGAFNRTEIENQSHSHSWSSVGSITQHTHNTVYSSSASSNHSHTYNHSHSFNITALATNHTHVLDTSLHTHIMGAPIGADISGGNHRHEWRQDDTESPCNKNNYIQMTVAGTYATTSPISSSGTSHYHSAPSSTHFHSSLSGDMAHTHDVSINPVGGNTDNAAMNHSHTVTTGDNLGPHTHTGTTGAQSQEHDHNISVGGATTTSQNFGNASVAAQETNKTYSNDIQILIYNYNSSAWENITANILSQIGWVQLGDGTSVHALVTDGTPIIDMSFLLTRSNFFKYVENQMLKMRFTQAGNYGGKLSFNFFV